LLGWTKPRDVENKHVQFFDLHKDPRQREDLTRRVGRKGAGAVYMAPKAVEVGYIKLLLSMKHIYSEWTVENDRGYLANIIDKLLTNQLTSRPPNDHTYSQYMDNKTLSEINEVVFKPNNDKKAFAARDTFVKEEVRKKRSKNQKLKNKEMLNSVVGGRHSLKQRGGARARH
jgi:hypothetical protein